MRKRITLLVGALMIALTMSFGSIAAFADTQACTDAQKNAQWDCKGNKLENPGGHSFGKVPNN
jgi:Spy/CpxP family protein refolding chaperone